MIARLGYCMLCVSAGSEGVKAARTRPASRDKARSRLRSGKSLAPTRTIQILVGVGSTVGRRTFLCQEDRDKGAVGGGARYAVEKSWHTRRRN
ncbi:hypothetical protein MTO96_022880 [Rhipicephalus appendiculatus]